MSKIDAEQPEVTEKKDTGKDGIHIKKIKYCSKNKELEVHYKKYCGSTESKDTVYKSKEEPQQVWFNHFYTLLDEMIDILELPEEYADNTEMRGLTISDGYGCTLTAVKKFPDYDNKAFCINTPHLPMREDDKGGATLPAQTVRTVETLIKETIEYMNGKRRVNQLKLVNQA